MDSSDNLLDYEGDDDVQNNVGDNSLQKEGNSKENELNENSRFDDQYLQIDISDEKDSLFFDVGLLGTVDGEKEKDEKGENSQKITKILANKEPEISSKNKASKKENVIENKNVSHNGNTTPRVREVGEFRKSHQRRSKFRQKNTNCVAFNLNERFFQTNSNTGTYLNFNNSGQWGNNSLLNLFQPSFNTNRLSYPIYNYLPYNRSYQAKILSENGILQRLQNINPDINQGRCFQPTEGCRGVRRRALNGEKLSSPSTKAKHNSLEVKPPEKRAFEEYEKKTAQLKKEARLKRFMRDESKIMSERTSNSCPKKVEKSECPNEKCSKDGSQIKETSSSDNEQHSLLEGKPKPDINKESLLKKRNPFEDQSETSNHIPRTKVKEENGKSAGKDSKERCFYVVKNDTESHVKFVRSAPKSFSELPLKSQNWSLENENSLFPHSVKTLSSLWATNGAFLSKKVAQMASQLTGCIVKVLNIPPTTTTNDILTLCQPIGMVMEVKVNFPKENSVVIRFKESSSAEKFYSVYHGQKLNNNFLNVIVV